MKKKYFLKANICGKTIDYVAHSKPTADISKKKLNCHFAKLFPVDFLERSFFMVFLYETYRVVENGFVYLRKDACMYKITFLNFQLVTKWFSLLSQNFLSNWNEKLDHKIQFTFYSLHCAINSAILFYSISL